MMFQEFILVVDEFDQPVSSILRSDVLSSRLWRRACGGMVVDRKKRLVLCHLRDFGKDERAGVWVATFGGKSAPGEAPGETMRRELREEFGIIPSEGNIIFVGKTREEERRQFEYLFLVFADSTNFVVADRGEVADIKWIECSLLAETITGDGWYEYGYERRLLDSATLI